MVYLIPDDFHESAFIEDMGRHTELFDISHHLYSNNEHRNLSFAKLVWCME